MKSVVVQDVFLTDILREPVGTLLNPLVTANVGLNQTQLEHAHKFGYVDGVGTSPTSIREGLPSGTIFSYLSADATFEVLSSNPADTNIEVTIEGVNQALSMVSTTVNTDGANGTTPTPFPTQGMDVFRAYVSGGVECVGTLTIRVAGGGQIMAIISPIYQQSNIAAFTVPAGKVATLACATGSMGRNDDGVLYVSAQLPGKVFRAKDIFKSAEGTTIRDYTCGGLVDGINDFPAGTRFSGRTFSKTGSINAGMSFLIILKDA